MVRITHQGPGIWKAVYNQQPDTTVYALAISGEDIFAGTANGVYHSTDNGRNWIPTNDGLTTLDIRALTFKGSDLFAGAWAGDLTQPLSLRRRGLRLQDRGTEKAL